ncbi:MAG: hypothetical protein J1E01_11875 [Acetatifactor sp.]|nr:hypothetical protein [Acetatifactor sp.]
MEMTYDFILMAMRDEKLMKEIQDALSGNSECEIFTGIHKLSFSSTKQTVLVEACSDTSLFSHKIIPKEIPYSAVQKMLGGDWNSTW